VAVKRGKQLTRKAPLRRTRMQRRPGSTKYARRERHIEYMLWVKTLPCSAQSLPGHVCHGAIEADHAMWEHGKGEKCHDSECIPLCKRGHEQKTAYSGPGGGPFRTWSQDQMRAWLLGRIVHTQRTARDRGVAVPVKPPPKVPYRRDRVDADGRPHRLIEDIREVGNVDVRNPDAAPLTVARVVSEGDHR
jgi:hypothetical protein